MAFLNTRWARDGLDAEAASRAVLSAGQLMDVTGRQRLGAARVLLRCLAGKISLVVEYRGDYTSIEWAKYADFQCLASDSREISGKLSGSKVPLPRPAPASRVPRHKKPGCRSAAKPAESMPPGLDLASGRTRDEVMSIWLDVQAAFAAYAGASVPRTLSAGRRRAIAAAIEERCDPVAIVHGYMAFHDRHGPDFDPLAHFTPETVFRAAHRAKYSDAALRAQAERGVPPWPPRGRSDGRGDPAAQAARARAVIEQAAELIRRNREARDHERRTPDLRVAAADVLGLRPGGDT